MQVLYDDLNEQQRQAAEAANGPLLIIAGPGTGKTKTLVARIACLLERGVAPRSIAALTFTNKSAREIEHRVRAVLGGAAVAPQVATFHSLGQTVMRSHGENRRLITDQERTAIVRALTRPAGLRGVSVRELGLVISRAKTSLISPSDETVALLLGRYERVLAGQGLWDFDDLLRHAFELLQAGHVLSPYNHVLVDEFQDTSELQYEMLKLLAPNGNIFAIGDPNQSIYSFRGAGQGMFERFRADFPAVQSVTLTANYRSQPEIVALANAIFPDMVPLVAHVAGTGAVHVIQTLNEYSEANYVIRVIEQGIGGSDLLHARASDGGRQPRDYAVLYRTHRAARVLQRALMNSGLPYQIAGEGSPYERPIVQAVIAALRYLHDPTGERLPALKSWSDHQVKTALGTMDTAAAVSGLAAAVASRFGLEDEGLRQLTGMLVQFGAGRAALAAALQHIDAISSGEFYDPSVDAVTLMTIHAAKGLEFEHVFLIAAEEGTLPKLDKRKEAGIEEEKRLFYVAATRAKSQLDVLHTKTRGGEASQLSRFVTSLPLTAAGRVVDPSMASLERGIRKRAAKRAQGSLF